MPMVEGFETPRNCESTIVSKNLIEEIEKGKKNCAQMIDNISALYITYFNFRVFLVFI